MSEFRRELEGPNVCQEIVTFCPPMCSFLNLRPRWNLYRRLCSFQIHIDAHSDDDNPEYIAGMPFFRRPKTNAEISYFMQKNDVFIQVFLHKRV